jgi:ubiquinone/menaquinone biosynthesis C-methylase UbiE
LIVRGWNGEEAVAYDQDRAPSAVDRATAELVAAPPGGRLLELGCGPGVFARQVLQGESRLNYIGADLSEVFLNLTRRRLLKGRSASLHLLRCDALELPFRGDLFHCAVAMATLHHLSEDEQPRALQELSRVLVPGGQLLLVEDWSFTEPTPFENLAREFRLAAGERVEHHRTDREWRLLLRGAGFRVVEEKWVPRPFSLPYEERRSGADRALLDRIGRHQERQRLVRMWLADARLLGDPGEGSR